MEEDEGEGEVEIRDWAGMPSDALFAVFGKLDMDDILTGDGRACRAWRRWSGSRGRRGGSGARSRPRGIGPSPTTCCSGSPAASRSSSSSSDPSSAMPCSYNFWTELPFCLLPLRCLRSCLLLLRHGWST